MKTPLNVLVVLLALSLVACGGKEDPQSAPAATDAAVSQGEPADAVADEDDPPFEGEPAAPADETDFADRPGVSARDWAEAVGQASDSTRDRGQPDSAVADPTSVSAPSVAGTGRLLQRSACFATSRRSSRSLILMVAALSGPMRISSFWPAERSSSAGSANW